MVISNHPYHGGVHLNDVAMIAPFFSGDQIAGYAATIAHQVDIGGMAPGGYCMSTDLYQEGIIIPPIRLVSRGQVVDDVFNLIRENIRTPKQMAGDFRGEIGATMLGQQRLATHPAKVRRRNRAHVRRRAARLHRALGTQRDRQDHSRGKILRRVLPGRRRHHREPIKLCLPRRSGTARCRRPDRQRPATARAHERDAHAKLFTAGLPGAVPDRSGHQPMPVSIG